MRYRDRRGVATIEPRPGEGRPGVTLTSILDSFQGKRVLVLGDVMLDRYHHGTVERICPEAPVPVLRQDHTLTQLGGAGHLAVCLQALGADPCLFSAVGPDDTGRLVTRLAGAFGHILIDRGRKTPLKSRYIAGGQQLLRVDDEEVKTISDETMFTLTASLQEVMPDVDAVVISDYRKGVVRPGLAHTVIRFAKEHGKPVVVDTKSPTLKHFAGADLVTPNRAELARMTGVETKFDVHPAAHHACTTHQLGAVLATLSEHGMALVRPGENGVWLPTRARHVRDVTGAGDVVAAVMAAGLAAGTDLLDAAKLANIAAGLSVERVGGEPVSAVDLRAAMGDGRAPAEDSFARIDAWRKAGLTIGFTNGCFDLLHPGHLHLIREARNYCDRLVVGLNSDDSVRGLKGEGRPIQDEAARAAVLRALEQVDAVAIFDEPTPGRLIEQICPDVLIKGANYADKPIAGREFVEGLGGRVVLVDLLAGHSSTNLIERLAS